MKIYVESNFVLEVALQQEQSESCDQLLALCRLRRARLAIPAYSLIEPFETIGRRRKQRRRLKDELDGEMRQLVRSAHNKASLHEFDRLTAILLDSADDEQNRLNDVRTELVGVAEILPIDKRVLAAAMRFQIRHGLTPQDAIVYASVLGDLQLRRPARSCFLNRNARDFEDPDIVAALLKRRCRLIPSFTDGLEYVRSRRR